MAPRAIEFVLKSLSESRWYDQDAINAVLAGQWKQLDPRWQARPRLAGFSPNRAETENAWLVHFSGQLKPWLYDGRSTADSEFFEVLHRTEWRGWRQPATARGTLIGFYERRLRRSLYPFEVRALGWWNRRQGRRHAVIS